MTATKQIEILSTIGCERAIHEINHNHRRPLSSARLRHHCQLAIENGSVIQAVKLAEMSETILTSTQLKQLIDRSIEFSWIGDALYAAGQGCISKDARKMLIDALVTTAASTLRKTTALLDCGE